MLAWVVLRCEDNLGAENDRYAGHGAAMCGNGELATRLEMVTQQQAQPQVPTSPEKHRLSEYQHQPDGISMVPMEVRWPSSFTYPTQCRTTRVEPPTTCACCPPCT